MLCAKNLKTVKAVLIMILGVGGFTSAQAALDLTSPGSPGAGHDVLVYAAETIETGTDATKTTVDKRRYTMPRATSGVFTVDANVGYALPDETYYVRYDLVARTACQRSSLALTR